MTFTVFNQNVLIDDEDLIKIQKYKWYLNRLYSRVVIQASIYNKSVSLGRYLLNYNGPLEVDHKDKNPFNNQKSNLRLATRQQQMANSCPQGFREYKGVYEIKNKKLKNKFKSVIKYNQKSIHLGYFNNKEAAARAYDKKAKELFGNFAYLNFKENSTNEPKVNN